MVAEYTTERTLQEVARRVVTHNCLAAVVGNNSTYGVANLECAVCNGAEVNINAVCLFGVGNVQVKGFVGKNTGVTDLTAALAVEGGVIKNNGAVTLGYFVHGHIVNEDGKNLCVGFKCIITNKVGCGNVFEHIAGSICPTADVGACFASTNLLLLHKLGEACFVDSKTCFLCDLASQVNGEAVGIVKLEYILARKGGEVVALCIFNNLVEDGETCIDGCIESFFFHRDHLENVILLFGKLGVCALGFTDSDYAKFGQEGAVDAKELTVTASATENAAQNVAATLVGGDNAVGDHKGSGTDVVGNNTNGNIGVLIDAVFLACDSTNVVKHLANGVNLKHVVNALHYASETLKTHAGIDVLLCELGVGAIPHVVELSEYVVPNFHKAVAVTTGLAIGRATAILNAAVKIDFGARAARTCAVLPEVISLTEANDVLGVNAYLLHPNVVGLLVLNVDGGPKQVGGDFKSFGQKFPRPRNCLILKVIAKGEVTKHFKESAVTCGVTNALKVGGADALLASGYAVARGFLFTGEEFLHRRHARVDEQQRFVIDGNERERGQTKMSFRLKESQILFAQFVKGCPFHRGISFR